VLAAVGGRVASTTISDGVMRFVSPAAGDPLIDAFHRGIYWDEFADQHEPVAVWHAALAGGKPYELTIDLALDDASIVGGICYERYPRSGCGLVTYMVVAPAARGRGLGRKLQLTATRALLARGAPLVLGEINDPRVTTLEPAGDAWTRVQRNQRWGVRILDVRYIQPALGPGLARDHQLLLVALPGAEPLPRSVPGAVLRDFVDEFYGLTEGGAPDAEITIPDTVRCFTLAR